VRFTAAAKKSDCLQKISYWQNQTSDKQTVAAANIKRAKSLA
jgi:hypothetical protein